MVKRVARSNNYGTPGENLMSALKDLINDEYFIKFIEPKIISNVSDVVNNYVKKYQLDTQLAKNDLMRAVFIERFEKLKLEEKKIKNLELKNKAGMSKARMIMLQSCADNIDKLTPEWLGYIIALSINEQQGSLNLDKGLIDFLDNFSAQQREEILNDLKDLYKHTKWQRERTRRQADEADFEEI